MMSVSTSSTGTYSLVRLCTRLRNSAANARLSPMSFLSFQMPTRPEFRRSLAVIIGFDGSPCVTVVSGFLALGRSFSMVLTSHPFLQSS